VKTIKVRELMIPLAEYARIDESKTLFDAIRTLRKEQLEKKNNAHSSILVVTNGGDIATMLTILDIFRFMEPKYKDIQDLDLTRFGMQPDYAESIFKSFDLWASPLEDLCKKTMEIPLKDIKPKTIPREVISEDATLDMAIHRMIIENKRSLLVEQNHTFVGVLRSIDAFKIVCKTIETCNVIQND